MEAIGYLAMATERTHDPMLWSTVAIALLVAITAVAGLYWPATYARETPYSRAGGYPSDIVDFFLHPLKSSAFHGALSHATTFCVP
jgi:hypothetical protein